MKYYNWDRFICPDTEDLIHHLDNQDEISETIATTITKPTIELNEEREE
jgi:hypothetical protein